MSKPPHTSATTLIATDLQSKLISQLIQKHQEEGGSFLAQVFFDGFRIRVLTPEQTKELAPAITRALGQSAAGGLIRRSAFDNAQEKGGEA